MFSAFLGTYLFSLKLVALYTICGNGLPSIQFLSTFAALFNRYSYDPIFILDPFDEALRHSHISNYFAILLFYIHIHNHFNSTLLSGLDFKLHSLKDC